MENDKPISKKKRTANTTPVRIKKTTARSIKTLLNKLNKKAFGRSVTTDDIISGALKVLKDDHFEEIKKATYSSEDHLELQFQEYCKVNGQISKNKYIELLLKAGLPTLNNPD